MRVLLAPTETAAVANAIAGGLRRRGHRADLVTFAPHPFGLPQDRLAPTYAARAREGLLAPFRYDVLHYQFGTSLCEFIDTAWARVARRRLALMHYWGDDCRTRDVAERLHPARAAIMDAHVGRDEATVVRRLRLGGRLCHAALVSDLELASYVAPHYRTVYVIPLPLALPLRPDAPLPPLEGEGPIVLHAPSSSAIKGTAEILAAAERLAARRPLRVRKVSGVSHEQVLAEIARADVVIDQLNSETYGIFALEAMALGKPTVVQFRRDAVAPAARAVPLVPVTADTVEAELEALCDDPGRRAELGRRGAEFVPAVHDADRIAAALEHVYAHAHRRPPGIWEAAPDGPRPLDVSFG